MKTKITAILGLVLIGARMAQAQFTYSTNDGVITVTGYTGPGGAVTIPNFVHSIGDFACQGNTNITSLVISDSVTNLGEFAFGECSRLGSVIIGHGLGTIGYAAFENCDSLTSVAMSDSVTNIDDGAFLDSISMTSVTIPGSVVRIGNGAFCNAALTSITIPEGVATIGDAAFYNARLVGTVTIPASVSSIGEAPFEISEQLTAIYVEPGNLYYSSQGGVLFDYSGTTLIECPGGESGWPPSSTPYVIPSSVTTLAPDAFGFCNLYGVVIPDSVTNIEDRAFYACESLTGITIPNSVTSIGSAVFAGCYALTSINVNSGNPAYVSVTGVLYSQDQTSLIAYPPSEGASSYSVSADVTSIEDRAFEACQNLTNIVIPNSVTNLGFNAMAYCNNLAAVYFEGNAPAFESIGFFNDGSVGGSPFDDDSGATAYYLAGARGWSASYGGAPTAELTAISLSAAPTNGRAPLTVDFTSSNLDQSNNTISNWDWNFNDGLTSVEQNPSHTFTNYGSYAVALVETNSVGVPVAGSAVTVNVLGTPVITSQPSAQTTRLGGIVVLQVQASGAAPLTYQWKFDNAELSNGAHIIGAASNVLKLSDVTTANTGSYMVIVRNQYGSITSAPTVVTILPQGNTKLTIISPKSGQSVSNPVLLVTGTATDTVPVNDVYYQLNGGGWSQATPGSSWSNWTANVTLNRGPNTISAYAEDTSGNFSSTNSISFFYVVTATLVVTNTGKGTLSPDYNNQSLAIGSNYSMTATATAAAGFAFTNWTGGTNQPFTILTNRPKLTFTMESNLTLIANFVDVTPPSLTLTSPTAHQRWSNSLFTATGTARDNVQVSNVFCQLNGGNWMPAAPGNATWSNWTATLTPLQSTNVLAAYAVDTSGNKSATNKVTFLYIPSATLTVQTNGLGAINPVDSGKLLALGTNYTLTASPGRNWLFSNWVGGTTLPYSALSTSSNYSFVMQSNLFLRANFVTNPFLAVAGVYNGLFYPTNGVTEASSGFVSVAIASNSPGAYTAKLLLDGGSNSFSGSFDLMGTVRTNLARSGKTPVSVTLSLDFNPADALMGGSVSNAAAGWNSVIQADRAVFSATADPATNYAGQFTLLLPPDTNAPVGSPGGYGYAAITNTLGGISTLGGALADGTPFLWSVPVARNGGVPLYQSLYSGKGSLLGWIYFTNEPPQNVSADSSVSWIKPSVPNTLYPSGFTNLTGVLGSPFTNTTKAGVPVLNLTSATLFLSNGNLKGGTLIFTNINSAKNSLTNLAGGTKLGETNYLVLAINTNNGLVTVTFKATGAKTNTVGHGTVLQNQTNAAGYFLGTNQSGAFMLENQ